MPPPSLSLSSKYSSLDPLSLSGVRRDALLRKTLCNGYPRCLFFSLPSWRYLANSLSHAIIDTCSPASITFFPCLISLLLQRPKNTFSAKQFLPQKKSVVIIIRDVTTFVTHGKRESRANKFEREKKKVIFGTREPNTSIMCKAKSKWTQGVDGVFFFFLGHAILKTKQVASRRGI